MQTISPQHLNLEFQMLSDGCRQGSCKHTVHHGNKSYVHIDDRRVKEGREEQVRVVEREK